MPDDSSINVIFGPALQGIAFVFILSVFAAFFTSIILVSRRIIDTQDSPKIGRGSRIFVLCICFFYIAIGMFFIAPKLKNLKIKLSAAS